MALTLSDELKKAIKALPDKEKDKLLLRLIPKNELLVRQLEFKLLEDASTTYVRREELREKVEEHVSNYPDHFYSPGYLLTHMREISGLITRHKNITKDKTGEIELNLFMLTEILERNHDNLLKYDRYYMMKFDDYVVKRILKILKLLEKIHEDYRIEFTANMQKLGHLLANQPTTMKMAINNMLDVNDLLSFQ
jgi:hypothetical protein